MSGWGGSPCVRVGGLKGQGEWTQTPRRTTREVKAEAEAGAVPPPGARRGRKDPLLSLWEGRQGPPHTSVGVCSLPTVRDDVSVISDRLRFGDSVRVAVGSERSHPQTPTEKGALGTTARPRQSREPAQPPR